MAFTKYADCEVLNFSCSRKGQRTAALAKIGSFEYEPATDGNYLYVAVRACTADVPNLNLDMLPSWELETAYETFRGASVFLNHDNSDPAKARGVVVDAKYHDEDPDDKWVEILMEMDEDRCPKLCSLIRSGEMDTVSMGCFVPGTKITMSDGTTKCIEEVSEGDSVLTLEGEPKRVSYTMAHDHHGVVYEIASYGQPTPMRLTEEHPVWVRRGTDGDYQTVRSRIRSRNSSDTVNACICGREFSSHRSLAAHVREAEKNGRKGHGYAPAFEGWVPASEIEVGDFVLTPKRIGTLEDDGNRTIARLVGYFMAEGNYLHGANVASVPGQLTGIELTFNENEVEYQKEVENLISELGYKPVGPYRKNGAATVRCNSADLAERMYGLVGSYSYGKRLSSEAMSWGVECHRCLLEAYINGDGTWTQGSNGRHFQFSTCSRDMAEQIYMLMVECGIRCSVPKRYHPESHKDVRPHWYAQGEFDYSTERNKKLAYIDDKGLWRRVTRVRLLDYDGPVYNFEVEDSHSYVAEAVAVHNCNVESTTCSVCGNVAEYPFQYCTHVQQKGREFDGKVAFEICNGIEFFEESWVYDPADPTAHAMTMMDSDGTFTSEGCDDMGVAKWSKKASVGLSWGRHGDVMVAEVPEGWFSILVDRDIFSGEPYLTASFEFNELDREIDIIHGEFEGDGYELGVKACEMWYESMFGKLHSASVAAFSDEPRTPAPVDTKETDKECPACGEDTFDGETCSTCGYAEPPEGMDDIDLDDEDEVEDVEDSGGENKVGIEKMNKKQKQAGRVYVVEYVYEGDSWSNYLGQVLVEANSPDEAIDIVEREMPKGMDGFMYAIGVRSDTYDSMSDYYDEYPGSNYGVIKPSGSGYSVVAASDRLLDMDANISDGYSKSGVMEDELRFW